MHEMALAEGVMATALASAHAQGDRPIRRLVIRVGQLQQIHTDVMRDCLQSVQPPEEPLLQNMVLELEIEPAAFACRACQHPYGLDDLPSAPDEDELEAIHFVPELAHSYIQCPSCGSPDFEVVSGRGVAIERIEVAR